MDRLASARSVEPANVDAQLKPASLSNNIVASNTYNNNNNNNNDELDPARKQQPLSAPPLAAPTFPSQRHTSGANNNGDDDDVCDTLHDRVSAGENQCAASGDSASPPASPQSSCNSSYGSRSGRKLMNASSASAVSAEVPGGVVTTQNISTVIKPRSNNNSLQFVKIQTPELSKKAVEQIRIAEATKSSKEKIKEVEAEWQNNLLSWKSKRRQQFVHAPDHEPDNSLDYNEPSGARKIKTFAEMIEQRAKSNDRLGAFHLRRYISSGDDEDDEPIAVEPPTEQSVARQLFSEQERPLSSESGASTNGSSQLPSSKLSTQRDGYEQQLKIHDAVNGGYHDSVDSSKSLHESASRCDNESALDEVSLHEQSNKHSISLVANAPPEHLNSTLKQEIKPSPVGQRGSLALVDVGAKTREASVATLAENDESDNSGYEDDEEGHEEEQKYQQRIAFVAKLKAFENLTRPSVAQAPKIAHHNLPPRPSSRVTKPLVPNKRPTMVDQPKPVIAPRPENDRVIPRQALDMQPLKQILDMPVLEPTPELTSIEKTSETPPPDPTTAITPIKQPVEMKLHAQAKSSTLIEKPTEASMPKQFIETSLLKEPINVPPPKDHIDTPPPKQPLDIPMQPLDMPPLKVTEPRQLPPKNKSNNHGPSINQRKLPPPLKDDKERPPPLQVSGKKRCSSCKEELGRGAAAFVVESLSLVYHTNCFRCSVCHVNLSNGFRGVDVRVHAGALHCQNCYSKDGLNYSRV